MNYYNKYKKYKNKYLALANKQGRINSTQKYAIVMLCILKDHYVLGACINAHLHKLFLEKMDLDLDLVIMCDDYIYDKYRIILENYFDKVVRIKLRHYEPSDKYDYAKHKYSTWIGYSLSKWECIKFTEYDKILFLDVDILPNNHQFYDLFSFGAPAIYIKHRIDHKCNNNSIISFPTTGELTFDDYIKNIEKYGNLDGGLILLKPDLELYEDYLKMTDDLFRNGIYSSYSSGPDETSLAYYFISRQIPVHEICIDYSVIPWDDVPYVRKARAYNFLSFVKPWTKPKFLCWDEEMLWRYIYDKMPHSSDLEDLFQTIMDASIGIYMSYPEKQRKRYYNQDYIRKFSEEFKEIIDSKHRFDKIMHLDAKIHPPRFGILKTDVIETLFK